ncbi:MAG TPA: type ISP restriction/modification enzyme, partial [Terriglobales bacterium]
LDLGGNVRKNPKLSGTTHNVFGIQVGVSIALLVRKSKTAKLPTRIFYASVGAAWRKEEKYRFLDEVGSRANVDFAEREPNQHHDWLGDAEIVSVESMLPVAERTKRGMGAIFKGYSLGVSINRDAVAYSFQATSLERQVKEFVAAYDSELDRFKRSKATDLDKFVDHGKLKWSRNLKRHFLHGDTVTFDPSAVYRSIYRPFTSTNLLLADVIVDEPGSASEFFKNQASINLSICIPTAGARSPFWCFCVNSVPNLNLVSIDACQYLPYHAKEGTPPSGAENVTDWALNQFRTHYSDPNITKWDIFHYVYAVLHHPQYRERYAANLKRELPRIPFVGGDGLQPGESRSPAD